MTKPLPGDEDIEMDEQLFYWILELGKLVDIVPEGKRGEIVFEKLFELRKSMIGRLRTLGGEWINRLP